MEAQFVTIREFSHFFTSVIKPPLFASSYKELRASNPMLFRPVAAMRWGFGQKTRLPHLLFGCGSLVFEIAIMDAPCYKM